MYKVHQKCKEWNRCFVCIGKGGRREMLQKKIIGWIVLLCLLLAAAAYAGELTEKTMNFGADAPDFIRQMLSENGYADASVVCGALIEREGYDERNAPNEVSTAFLITERGGQRELTGIQWAIGTSNVHMESYGSCGLDLDDAVSINAIIDGSSPINRRFALRLKDGSVWEFLSTYQSSWRFYQYIGPDGFVCRLNSGRMNTDSHYFYVPCSAWLGNWPDLSRFPTSDEEASDFMGQCWAGVNDRCLVWGANLRTKPTGSARSLGQYHVALAEVLEEKPGKQLPWYHVRIGNAEGWISGPYVVSPTDQEGFAFNGSLGIPWAQAQTDCPLYAAMSDKNALMILPPQTFMQVLAYTEDGWAHVLVTDRPQDFSLAALGTYGYVRLDSIALHSPWTAF